MKNLTDIRKTVETDVDLRWLSDLIPVAQMSSGSVVNQKQSHYFTLARHWLYVRTNINVA